MAALATVINLEERQAAYMGNPQTDDGFTRIANELFDAIIRFPFSGRQQKVMLAIIRKTYGFGKKSDAIAQSQISDMTGIAKSHVCKTMKELQKANAIFVEEAHPANKICINKKYLEWSDSYQISNYQKGNCYQIGSYQIGNETVTKSVTQELPNRSLQKKDLKKERKIGEATEKRVASPLLTLAAWIEKRKAEGKKVIAAEDAVFDYAEKAGISREFMYLCWELFKDRYTVDDKHKTYRDWSIVFRKAVKGNWFKLWAFGDDGKAFLTSVGRQASNVHGGEE